MRTPPIRLPLQLPLLAALLLPAAPAAGALRVLATVPDLAAIARAVAGPRAEVTSLTLPTQDPHFVDARPHLSLQLNRADLLLVVGLDLEAGWLPVLLKGARNPAILPGRAGHLDCSAVVRLREVQRTRVDRSMGDIHPGGNPHYLVDPDNAARVARALARRLAKLDAEGRGVYAANAERLAAGLAAARARWRAALAPYGVVKVVTYHRSWVYFTEALGLRTVAYLEPKPGVPPSAAHVLSVIRAVRREGVKLLLQEEYYPDRTARLLAEKTGARLLLLPGGTRLRQGQSFLQRLDATAARVIAALAGKGG